MSNIYKHIVRVYYEDTDAGGIVYYANYLKFIERARTEMIYQQLGCNHQKLKKDFDLIFVVRSCNLKYLKSAKFEDELSIFTKILKKTPVRLNLRQEIKRKDEVMVIADIELATIDSKGKIQKISKNLLSML